MCMVSLNSRPRQVILFLNASTRNYETRFNSVRQDEGTLGMIFYLWRFSELKVE